MKPIQVEIRDDYKIWGIFNVLKIGWNFHNHKIEHIGIDWYKTPDAELLYMTDNNFDNNFINSYGNLYARIL